MSRVGGGDVVETETCSLIGNSGFDKAASEDVLVLDVKNLWRCTDYKMGSTVLNCLKFADQGLRETSQESCISQCVRVREKREFSWHPEVVANSTNTSDFHESSFADEIDVFFRRENLVWVETKVSESGGREQAQVSLSPHPPLRDTDG